MPVEPEEIAWRGERSWSVGQRSGLFPGHLRSLDLGSPGRVGSSRFPIYLCVSQDLRPASWDQNWGQIKRRVRQRDGREFLRDARVRAARPAAARDIVGDAEGVVRVDRRLVQLASPPFSARLLVAQRARATPCGPGARELRPHTPVHDREKRRPSGSWIRKRRTVHGNGVTPRGHGAALVVVGSNERYGQSLLGRADAASVRGGRT